MFIWQCSAKQQAGTWLGNLTRDDQWSSPQAPGSPATKAPFVAKIIVNHFLSALSSTRHRSRDTTFFFFSKTMETFLQSKIHHMCSSVNPNQPVRRSEPSDRMLLYPKNRAKNFSCNFSGRFFPSRSLRSNNVCTLCLSSCCFLSCISSKKKGSWDVCNLRWVFAFNGIVEEFLSFTLHSGSVLFRGTSLLFSLEQTAKREKKGSLIKHHIAVNPYIKKAVKLLVPKQVMHEVFRASS